MPLNGPVILISRLCLCKWCEGVVEKVCGGSSSVGSQRVSVCSAHVNPAAGHTARVDMMIYARLPARPVHAGVCVCERGSGQPALWALLRADAWSE